MKYEVLLLGKTKDSFLAEGIDEYTKRLQHYAEINLKIIKVKKNQGSDQVIIEKEADLLLANLMPSTFSIALDSKGKQLSSKGLAGKIEDFEKTGIRHVTFIIGGPLGLSKRVLAKANLTISLSKMTFTHDMVRMILVEQLYRAHTILSGGRYHK
jgi:23S rRNA (pseudouridine1915-N3)-methyltransferase